MARPRAGYAHARITRPFCPGFSSAATPRAQRAPGNVIFIIVIAALVLLQVLLNSCNAYRSRR